MRVTLLGHASVFVEMDGATCLMDPVFFDPFEEGAVASCPKRTVNPELLPHIDLLVVSHRHPDHFDLRSLDRIPRNCDVICPADPLIVYALKQLGFAQVHPVHPMGEISSATFELFPTRSELGSIPEFGMVFKDRTGTFWNQVDSLLAARTIQSVRQRFGHIDLLFAMYASQNFDFFEDQSREFPYADHHKNLDNVSQIMPRMVAPGSAGFRFAGDLTWLNAFLFPISRERFAADLAQAVPGVRAQVMNPGDVFEINSGNVRHLPSSSPLSVTEHDDTALIQFNPTASVPELTDPNPDRYPLNRLIATTESVIGDGLACYLETADDGALLPYRRLAASYEIEVIFPDGSRRSFCFRVSPSGTERVGHPARTAEADVVHRIAASALVDWLEYRRSFFFVRGWSRRYQMPYLLARRGDRLALEKVPLPDLLIHYVTNVAPGSDFGAKRIVDFQLDRLRTGDYAARKLT